MIQIKKTILTLALLLTAVGGAWAQTETLLTTIESTDYESFTNGSKTFDDKVTVTFAAEVSNDGDDWGWFSNQENDNQTITVTAASDAYTITRVKFYSANGSAFDEEAPFLAIVRHDGNNYITKVNGTSIGRWGLNKIEVYGYEGAASSPSSGPEVDWDKDKKSGSFTMPGGNVTLEPEYYPQAAVAEGGVTAADADARATTDDPLVKVDATKLTGAKKLMYFVSNSGTAPAYDAEGWTDQLPTAKGFTQQGDVYVWYYPVGTDDGVDGATATYSDGDIMPLGTNGLVTIAAAPTYAVTFADDLAEPDKWSADPAANVTKGQTVTVTYSGTKKVIGVKVEKKAAAPAETTVTLTPGEIGGLVSGGSTSKTINGITIAVSGDANFHSGNGWMEVSAFDLETMEPIPATGTYTFTSSVGNIKRIDINHTGGNWWEAGDGWPGIYVVDDTSTFTWSGTPAASVTLNGSDNCSLYSVSSFVFTIEPTN